MLDKAPWLPKNVEKYSQTWWDEMEELGGRGSAAIWEPLVSNLTQQGKKVYKMFASGGGDIEKMKEFLTKMELEVLLETFPSTMKNEIQHDPFIALVGKETAVILYTEFDYSDCTYNDETGGYNQEPATSLSLNFITGNNQLLKDAQAFVNKNLSKPEIKVGNVYVLKASTGGYVLKSIGHASSKLIEENYSPEILADYKHMITDLASKNPCGRLNILYGEPGSGKTYLLRSMLEDVPNVTFVIIRPDLIKALANPDMVSTFIDQKIYHGRAVVFLLEDADSVLTKRMSDNMTDISSVLNTTDGILGTALDFRVVATTNARKVELDEALSRPGRLCKSINVGRLTEEHAKKILKRLGTEAELPAAASDKDLSRMIGFTRPSRDSKYLLADLYKAVYTEKHKGA